MFAPGARGLPFDRGARSISGCEAGRRPSFERQSAQPAATSLARRPPLKARAEWSPADEEIATLLVGLASGDELAFARFYLATRSRLLSVIARIERDSSEAEEILQEVYFNIWRRWGSARSSCSFFGTASPMRRLRRELGAHSEP